jgi:hypothetical protein
MATRAWRDKFGRDDDWKKSEEDVIKKYYKNNTDKQIAKVLGRTEHAVQQHRLGLKIKKASPHPRFWTPEETKILTSKYKNHTAKQIASDFLPDRSVPQIKDKLRRMRITKSMWTDEELDLLVEHGGKLSAKEIAKRFVPNKTSDQIRAKVLKGLGISRRKYLKEKSNVERK